MPTMMKIEWQVAEVMEADRQTKAGEKRRVFFHREIILYRKSMSRDLIMAEVKS